MLDPWSSYEILLASRSPRRSALMKGLGIPFRVVKTEHADEKYPADLSGGEIARYLAEHKSESYTGTLELHQVLLTADTIVWHRDRELGKPINRKEAMEMLRQLSGDTHQVFTGVCLRSVRASTSFFAVSDVTFSRLDSQEIGHYVDQFRPFDKAGAYGIQEWIGLIAVEKIVGSYFNVMGLPVQRVYSELKRFIGK
ncbi:MAG: Maf family nucleotide pyrophosphatase [Bacteroidales bacterium]|nr:Maf family nucleotide pyrophosphatase [Bacteroidales bacterium]